LVFDPVKVIVSGQPLEPVTMRRSKTIFRVFLPVILAFLSLIFLAPGQAAAASITTQPQNQTNILGSNAVFTVIGGGQTPLLYQWSFYTTNLTNSAHIGGATNATLTITNITTADAGDYKVVVKNTHGSVTSSIVTLTVLLPATIGTQPANQAVNWMGNAAFAVGATGTGQLNYRWLFNGTRLSDNSQISGSATSLLNISGALPANIGNYQVVVTNNYGSVTSIVATLNVTNVFHYVNLNNSAPQSPYTNWSTAATNIQSAVDVANAGDSIFVTNGMYTLGNRVTSTTTNCVVVTNAISISSVSGPAQTVINGGGTNRCIYLTNGCSLSGFTITNGMTPENGGGIFCSSTNVVITNCVVAGSSAYIQGGGVYQGTLFTCVLTNNYAGGNAQGYPAGGGAGSSVLYNCTVSWNSGGSASGGGLFNCTANQCVLTNNSTGANAGGGAAQSTLNNCLIANNSGCGAGDFSTLNNCTLIGNTAPIYGGGASYSTLTNCTLIANIGVWGGGAEQSTLYNCTLISNSVSSTGGAAYICTLSNCTLIANTASSYYGGGVDQSTLYNSTLCNNFAGQWGGAAYNSTLYNCTLSNNISDGEGGGAYSCILSNCVLTANEATYGSAYGGGAFNSTLITCLVSNNGAYAGGGAYGGSLSNCVIIQNDAVLGGGALGSTLVQCSVLNGQAQYGGGLNSCTASNCILTGNLAIIGSTGAGAGAYTSSLYNCMLYSNRSFFTGGGAALSTLINCTIASNTAYGITGGGGGGVTSCTLTNSIIYFNTTGGNYSGSNNMSWCCTTPLPNDGSGDVVVGVNNTSSAPLFVNLANGNCRLYPGSPGIDSGNNAVVPVTVDLDGNARIVNGTVDLGAYEFQNSPFIEVQPTNQTVPLGAYVTFSVTTYGPGLTYQWQFNGTNILGATSSTYVLSFAQYNSAGTYTVTVTNSYGVASSSNAVLTVVPPTPPSFTLQPTNQTVAVAANVTLAAAASGAPPAAYQWYFNSTALFDNGHYFGTGTSTLQIQSVPTNYTGNYFVVATNTGGSVTSSVANITVLIPPAITLQPTNQTVLASSNVTFSVQVTGSAPLGYQWYFSGGQYNGPLTDGGQFSGSTGTNLTISNLQWTNNGTYYLLATNLVGTAASTVVTLTVLSPPVLTAPFVNQVGMVFNNTTLALSVTGTPALYYQWQKNGTNLSDGGNISGSSGPALTITNSQLVDSGQYTAIVTNAYGALTNTATLTVVPIFDWGNDVLLPPADATNVVGIASAGIELSADFALRADGSLIGWGNDAYGIVDIPANATNIVSVTGGPEQTMAIRRDGTVVTWGGGGTNVPDAATNVVAVAIQGYTGCMALRQDGSLVTWNGVPTPPANATNLIAIGAGFYQCLGVQQNGTIIAWGSNYYGEGAPPANATNVIAVSGGMNGAYPYSAALRADGTEIGFGYAPGLPAAATNLVTIAAGNSHVMALRQDGTAFGYSGPTTTNCIAIAVNGYGFHDVVLTQDPRVTMPPAIIQSPLGAVIQTNQTFLLLSQAVGAMPMQSQWYLNGTPLAGQTNGWLLLPAIQTSQGGAYQIIYTNNFGSATSSPAIVWTPPAFTSPPATMVAFGSNAIFSETLAGTSPFGYQWYFNGTPLSDGGFVSGSATASLIVSNFQSANLGNYTLAVTNLAGSVTSSPALLTIVNPLVTTQPQGQSVLGGATVDFSVAATGQQPLAYQWEFDGTNILNATNDPLVLSNVLVSQSGLYSVIITNSYGTIVSSNATLTVTALSFARQPVNQTVLGGGTANFTVSINGQQPVFYQWEFDGTNLPGATNDPLVITNVLVSQSGLYSVVVTNAYGSVVSSNGTLTVMPLAFKTQPANCITWPSGSATFSVIVSGQAPFGFDWQCNGVDVPGMWTNVLTLTNVQFSQFGTYDVIVSNAYGSVVSTNAFLSLSQVAVWGGLDGESNLAAGLTNIIAIAGNGQSVVDCLALKANSTVIHWPRTNSVTISNILSMAGGGGEGPAMVLTVSNTAAELLSDDVLESITGFTNIVAVAPYMYSPLAIRTNGMLVFGAQLAGGPPNLGSITNITNAVAVTEGNGWSMVLKADGTVTAWGGNTYGQTNVPPNATNVIAIAGGFYHGLALRSDHTVIAWGLDANGQTNVPPGLSNVVAIAAGFYHSLALRANGTVVAWGQNTYGQTNVPPGLTNVIAIAAGAAHSMALIGNGPPVVQASISSPAATTNGFSLAVPSQSGRLYILQFENTLFDTNWNSLPPVPGNGGVLLLSDPTATNNLQRFYRVQQW
jgi:alpha-tubulin suppressor-like RCC1 family protein